MSEDAHFDPSKDPLLRELPTLDGYCLLPPCVIRGAIGRGGMGVVYHGRHVDFDIDVAVKCLDPALAEQNKNFVDRFQQEAQAAAQINHQNVVRVFTIGEAAGLYYLVMEYVEGETANQRVQRKGPLHVTEAIQIALGASRGLAAAHEAGLIHRDVKPDNILISPKGAIKLADLGLAKSAAAEGGMTQTGTMLGTPKYMPLEQWQSAKAVGPPCDVYAMGAVLWFLLVGRDAIEGSAPFEVLQRVSNEYFPDLAEARPDVPADVVEIVRRCTARHPEERYPSAVELVAALESVVLVERTLLVDEDCGSQMVAKTLISPPPPAQTLADVRIHFAGGGRDSAAAPEQPEPKKSAFETKHIAIAALAILLVAIGAWWGGGSAGDGEPEPSSTPPEVGEVGNPAGQELDATGGEQSAVAEPKKNPAKSTPKVAAPVADSRAPALTSATPDSGAFLMIAQPAVRLEFDEEVRSVSVGGQSLKVSGSVASGQLKLKKPVERLAWTAKDSAGNVSDGELGIAIQAARVPSGWKALGKAVGKSGWVERAEDPRSGIVFRLISAGRFVMGSWPDEEGRGNDERRHWVEISKPFYLAETETTQAQWTRVMKSSPSQFDGSELPVENVSWNDANEFCEKLGYNLPTEAEWELACRAGSDEPFAFGATLTSSQANFDGTETYGDSAKSSYRERTVEVRSFEPNAFGLYDMHGNVWEWCADGYAPYEDEAVASLQLDPIGDRDSNSRVLRGGSWLSLPKNLRSGERYENEPVGKGNSIGFRAMFRP